LEKNNENIIRDKSKDLGRRSFLKSATIGAIGVTGLGFSMEGTLKLQEDVLNALV